MIDHISLLFWTAAASFVLYKIAFSVRDAAKARKLGCKPVPTFHHAWWDPFGVKMVRGMMASAKVGLLLDGFHERANIMKSLGKGARASPTWKVNILGRNAIVTQDPENVKAVLATQFADFGLARRKPFFKALLGDGIFTSDGSSWEHSRAMLRPSFVRERVSDLEMEERHNMNLLSVIPIKADGWTDEIDLQPLFFRLTLDSSTEFLFGESVNSQLDAAAPSNPGQDSSRRESSFAYAFDKAQEICATRGRLDSLYWLVNPPVYKESCKTCHDFADHYVQLALDSTKKNIDAEKGVAASKGQYIFVEELAQRTRDPIELRFQLMNVLLAGRDTTASLLGYLFIMLARNPAIYAKLREVIISDFGTRSAPREITFANLKSCRYLQACISETLRLYPVVPINGRNALRDTTLPRGGGPDGLSPVFVKKGQPVTYSVAVMHRDKALWGADADEFRPDRWEGKRHGWEFLPFNGGPRICLGQQFALTSASFTTVRLVQQFDVLENLDPDVRVRQNATLTSCSMNGVIVRMHEARDD